MFKENCPNSLSQVMFTGKYWATSWAALSKVEDMESLKENSRSLDVSVMDIFNKFGWKNRSKLHA
jgi:hypothetical protein